MTKKLTAKEQAFVEEYITLKNGYQAYCNAGYSTNMTRTAIDIAVCNIKRKPHIKEAIEKHEKTLQRKTQITAESLCEKLDRIYFEAMAEEKKQYVAAVSAVMGQAKLLGLIIDKAEIKASIYRPEDLLESIVIEANERKQQIQYN